MAILENLKASYSFFSKMEKKSKRFTLEDIANAVGWKPSTVRTYVTKKWDKLLHKEGPLFYVDGILAYKEDEYIRMMSQKNKLSSEPKRPDLPIKVERLVIKARESAMLALDIYNRPATVFKTEGFSVMMIIAWTALLHAIFEKRGISYIYYKNGKPEIIDGETKAWDLSKCLLEFFGSSTTAIKKNLEFFIGLRNKVEHRYVPDIDPHVGGECQALILNFDELLTSEFGDFYALRECLAVPLQTSVLRTSSQLEAMKKLQGKQYDKIVEYIDAFRDELSDEIYQDLKYSFRVFLIPKVGNHKESSDLAFEFIKYDPNNKSEMEAIHKQVTLIREKKVPVANQGKLKPKDVAELVSNQLGQPFNVHNHTQAWKKYRVRKPGKTPEGCDTKYCQFDEAHKDYVYTMDWVKFLVKRLSDEKEYESVKSYKGV